MPPELYSQNNNTANNDSLTTNGPERMRSRKYLLVAIGILAIIMIAIAFSRSDSQQSKYLKSATAAARKQIPNAKVNDLKVVEGFALATVNDPTANGQAAAGNLTYFKVNKDGSMTQLANGSSFSPVDLLGLGIPLATQAKLTGHNLNQTQQYLADACGYTGGNVPGYLGFNGSFSPGNWQIDAGTLDGLEQTLSAVISNKNGLAKTTGEKIICVNATRKNSNTSTDKQTYISTFTLELQFITANGAVTPHAFSFAIGPSYSQSYTLDGQKIQS